MDKKLLVSLAILKVNFDNNKDYLETFVPIVTQSINYLENDIISIVEVSESLKNKFSLEIPNNVLKKILKKVYKKGYIKIEKDVYIKDEEKLSKLNFEKIQNEMIEKQEDMINNFKKFCLEKLDVNISYNEAEKYFYNYIQQNLHRSLNKESYSSDDNGDYYIARFIADLIEKDSYLSNHIQDIIKGSMISTIIEFNNVNDIGQKFKETKVFLDTSLIIFALGYAGEIRKKSCNELIKLLYKNNAQIRCFRHTYNEIIGILDAHLHQFRNNDFRKAYGESIDYFREQNLKASDIELMIRNLEQDIDRLNIKIEEKPSFNIHRYVIDEVKLNEKLKENINYNSDKPLNIDVDSISSIMYLRRNNNYQKIELCNAIFVSSNIKLVRYANEFWVDEDYKGVMPIISDDSLTTVLWLKNPQLGNELTKKRLIATCYASIQPSVSLWEKYIKEIDRLEEKNDISQDNADYFRYAPLMKECVMELSKGDENVITEGTVKEIIEMQKKSIQEEATKVWIEKNRILKEKNNIYNKEIESNQKSIENHARKEAQKFANKIKGALVISMIVFIILNVIINDINNNFVKLIFRGVALINIVLSFINMFNGDSILSICKKAAIYKYDSIMKDFKNDDVEISQTEKEVAISLKEVNYKNKNI